MIQTTKKLLFAAMLLSITSIAIAQDSTKQKTMDIYGFIMMDAGYNFDQIHPDWFDVVRPTKLPVTRNQYGTDGNTYFSVRQTRLGFKNYFQTPMGELKTQFEFEMFGTGADAGQTTIRLRHAYAELGKWGVGQTWSPFMDIDVFPNTVEYWGPTGMAFFRNVQLRYMPIQGATRLTIALERPGASADQGTYAGGPDIDSVKARFVAPDLSAEFRKAGKFGYVELAGILRSMKWEDQDNTGPDYSGNALGWGLNLSTNINIGKSTVFRGAALYGEGVENYMNDATVDVAIKNPTSTSQAKGVALPVLGVTAFIDHNWNSKFSTAIGYSMIDIDNSDGQEATAFHRGQYAAANLMYYPVKNAMLGVEFQWGDRENFKSVTDPDVLNNPSITKVQLSFKYNFSQSFFKKAND